MATYPTLPLSSHLGNLHNANPAKSYRGVRIVVRCVRILSFRADRLLARLDILPTRREGNDLQVADPLPVAKSVNHG
jgi:hypothetical protein